jgi:hydrogenase-4 component E
MEEVIRTLSLAMILTSFVAVESRNLRRALYAYMAQALLMVAVIAAFSTYHETLAVWAATALVTKFGIVSWLLFRAIARGDATECPPRVGPVASALIIAAIAVTAYELAHRNIAFLAPTPAAEVEPFRTNVAVALTLVAVGFHAIVSRRDALKVVLGLCLIENGAHLSLVSLAPTMRETILVGVATDVVAAVFLLLYLIQGIEERIGSRDTSRLTLLRG